MLTLFSGLLVLSLLVFVHEFGHFVVAKRAGVRVDEFGFGYPLPDGRFTLKLFERDGTIYTVNPIPFGGFVRMGEDDPQVADGIANQSKLVRLAVFSAGSVMNFLLAIVVFALAFMMGWPQPLEFNNVMIAGVLDGSPAEAAGLEVGDIVLRVDGQGIKTPEDLAQYSQKHGGQKVRLVVKRGRQTLEIYLTPRESWPKGEGPMGIIIQPTVSKIAIKTYPPGRALLLGVQETLGTVGLIFYVPVALMRGILSVDMARPVGLVGIVQMAGDAAEQVVSTGWLFPILHLTAMLSAALAVTNMLPLPALDGGRILFVLIEAIRGKRVAPEKEGAIHLVGIIVLLALMLLITYQDIIRPVPSFDWSSLF